MAAATSVLKLVVDDKEYEASIKEAKRGMLDLEKSLRETGKSFADVEKSIIEYAKGIGEMNTVAKESKSQLREMSQTLTDLTRVYRQLSEEEKSSEFGKNLLQSIDKLTERAGEVQDAMGDVQASIRNAASDTRLFDQISGGAQLMTNAFQTAQGAAKLLGIELGDNVEVLAKLQAAMAVTSGLQQVQTLLQKQSALMQGIIALQTKFNILAKANPYALLATGAAALTTALFFLTKKEDEQVKKMEEAKKAAEDLKKEYDDLANKTVGNLYGKLVTLQASWEKLQTNSEKTEWIKENSNAFKELGISISSIKDAEDILINNTSAIVEAITLRARAAVLTKQIEKSLEGGITNPGSGDGYAPEGKYTLGYSVSQNLAKELADVEMQIDAITKKWQKGAGGGGGKGGGLIDALVPQYSVAGLTEDLKYLQQEQQKATSPEEWRTYADAIRAVEDEILKVKGELSSMGLVNTTGQYSAVSSGISLLEQARKNPQTLAKQKIDVSTVEKKGQVVSVSGTVGALANEIGNIANGLENLGVEIPEGFKKAISAIQTVASILTAISSIITIIAAIQGTKAVPVIGWALARGGIVPHAANGYYVPGNNYSNDMVPALLNSGELVLNKAAQGNLAAQLSGAQGGYAAQPYVNGEMILLGTNNHLRRSGQGEVVTTKMLRSYGLIN